jgi:hypothetical protein
MLVGEVRDPSHRVATAPPSPPRALAG